MAGPSRSKLRSSEPGDLMHAASSEQVIGLMYSSGCVFACRYPGKCSDQR